MTVCTPRVSYGAFTRSFPAIYSALTALGKSVSACGIEPELVELVELRVSQINGCAFCVQHHLSAARRLGVSEDKVDLLTAWHEANVFSEREMAALAWAEALTRLNNHASHDQAWSSLTDQFTEDEAVALTTAIGTINAWNRLGVGFRFSPQKRGDGRKDGN